MNYLVARVSDVKQIESLPAQKRRVKEYARKKGWVVGRDCTYVEFDETAFKSKERKRFKELVLEPIAKTKQTEPIVVVFDKVDRFSRDSSGDEKVALVRLCRENKIELHFPHDHLIMNKDSSATEWFQLDVNIALAGYYSAAIRDNVKRRFDQLVNDGIWIGRAPIGYENFQEHDAKGEVIFKGIRLDPERDHLIKEGFEHRSTGLPYKVIAKMMKKKGLRSRDKGKPIGTSQWAKILENPFYVGRMKFHDVEYEHTYPSIIEPWLWDKVQDVNNQRGQNKTKYNSKPFLFKRLRCHECGYSITFDGPKGKGNNVYGKCTEYGGKHGAQWFNESVLYDQIRELLRSIQLPKDKLPELIKEIEKNHAKEQEFYTKKKQSLQAEYDKLDEELEELFKDRKQFASRHDIFERMTKKIEVRQKEILDEVQDHSDGDKAFVIGASYLLDVCSRAVELFDAESSKVEQKRYLLDFILSNATLEGEKLHFTLKEPFESVINMQKTQNWCGRRESNSHHMLGRHVY